MRARVSAPTAAVPCGAWARTSLSSSTMCPPRSGLCATSGRGSAAARTSASCRRRCRPCLSSVAGRVPGCSRTCWCPSTPTISRFTVSRASTPDTASTLARSTLADWVGRSAKLLEPLVDALERHVMGRATLHADDTPVPVLAPGAGRIRTGRLWTYTHDERGAGGEAPPAVLFRYAQTARPSAPPSISPRFRGDLHADGYAGFDRLYGERIAAVACWAHVRRKFFDVHAATGSATAREALEHIAGLYAVEHGVRGVDHP